MNVEQAISRIKAATHDISDEYSNERCIEFLNTSAQQIGGLLCAAKWPPMAQEMELHDGDRLPDNYMHSCGTYPIRITNGIVSFLDGSEVMRYRYFSNPEFIENTTDAMPFDGFPAIQDVVVKTAVILALNENEYDVSQDNAIRQELMQAIAGGMGANATG